MANLGSDPAGEDDEAIVGTDGLTPDEVRKWADTVQWGECITFPNGLVIDKRGLPSPAPMWSGTGPSGGYQCGVCKAWVPPNTMHVCGGFSRSAPSRASSARS